MVHVKLLQIFEEAGINSMADMELRTFEAHLDTMMDQLSEESTELIIERPRYAHAVMVFASGDEPGELLTASRIKMLDPIYVPVEASTNGHQILHHYSEDRSATSATESTVNDLNNYDERKDFDFITRADVCDDCDIQKALKKLEESRSMLDERIIPPPTNELPSKGCEFDCVNDDDTACSKTSQVTTDHPSVSPKLGRSISERYAALKEGDVVFPSQLRQERQPSASSDRSL
ncbi:unnamed protein product [Litomosoides sigmodontis]|uniref:Uncharacterized protein n=1 Tax=Litomosoides sigmodontis TaxID=42156 RepID=A0A3P6SWY6_LITSI|nr:unnamed protein product [Litomosoides sigmodontis]